MKTFAFIRDIFIKYSWLCIAGVVLSFVTSLFSAVSLLTVSPLIDLLVHADGRNYSSITIKILGVLQALHISTNIVSVACVMLTFVIIGALLNILLWQFILKIKYVVMREIMLEAMGTFFSARWLFFSGNDQGVLFNTFNRELTMIGNGFSSMGLMFAAIIQIGIFLVLPFYISWQVTLLSMFIGGLVSLMFVGVSGRAYQWGRENTETANHLMGLVSEGFVLAKIILGYANQRRTIASIAQAFDKHQNSTICSQMLSYSIPLIYRLVAFIVAVTAILSARFFQVSFSEVSVLLLSLYQATTMAGSFATNKTAILQVVPAYEQLCSLTSQAKAMKQPTGGRVFQGITQSIRFEKVHFSYPGHPEVLKGVDIEIPRGKMVALVGPSGTGKTTVVDLLVGLHEPSSGQVLIDGVRLFDYEINTFRMRVGYVPQESVLFNATIRENLLWVSPEAPDDDIVQVCRMAYAEEFIQKLPKGLNTVVGDRGVRLSGGQVQRIALARAFLRKPDILVLDEATSSLDGHSETCIRKAVEEFARHTTVLVVAHRISTIQRADIIYVLDKGRVIESGSYRDLVAEGGYFASAVHIQEPSV